MTPRQLDPDSLHEKLTHLRHLLAHLEDLAGRLARSAGTRNILVHQYLEVDLALLAGAFARVQPEYGEYIRQVSVFVRDRIGRGEG